MLLTEMNEKELKEVKEKCEKQQLNNLENFKKATGFDDKYKFMCRIEALTEQIVFIDYLLGN